MRSVWIAALLTAGCNQVEEAPAPTPAPEAAPAAAVKAVEVAITYCVP